MVIIHLKKLTLLCNLPVTVMPDVVIDASNLAKSPINFEITVESFEQQPVDLDKMIPSFSTMSVKASPPATTTTTTASYFQLRTEKCVQKIKQIKPKKIDLKAKTVLDLKKLKRDQKKRY